MKQRKRPFPFSSESAAFMHSFTQELSGSIKKEREKYILPDNVQSFCHGIDWQSHNSSFPDEVSTLTKLEHVVDVRTDDVIANRIELIDEKVVELSHAMGVAFEKNLYATVSASCDRVGNTVSASGKSVMEAFLEMLERVEFGVNREGEPTRPSIHLGTEMYNAFVNDPLKDDPEFKKRVDEVNKRKSEEAIAREAERLSRFKDDHE